MDEINHYLQQLPNFLHSEVVNQTGSTHGLDAVGVVDRYWTATNHLIATKRAPLRQEHIDNANYLWNGTQSNKVDMENRKLLRDMPGKVGTDFYTMTITTDFYMQSIRFLSHFRTSLEALSAKLREQQRHHAQRLAEEAARQQAEEAARAYAQAQEAARLQAEAAARARVQAEETARRLAEEQAARQRAEEGALQLAQRQVEEAAKQLAQRKADERAALPESRKSSPIDLITGPEATIDIQNALNKLKTTIERAVGEFSDVINLHSFSDEQLQRLQTLEPA